MTTVALGPRRTWGRMTMSEAMGPSHAFIEGADGLRLILRGHSLGELAAEGGRALGERLRRPGRGTPGPGPWLELEVSGPDRETMLVNWLNRLLDLSGWLHWAPVECEVIAASDSGLRARVRGVTLPEPCRLERVMLRPNSHVSPDGRDLLADVILREPRRLIGCAARGGGTLAAGSEPG